MKLSVSHRITTRFDPERRRLLQSHRLTPTRCASQRIIDWNVSVSDGVPGAAFVDGAGDATATISTPGEVGEVTVAVMGEVETFDTLGVLKDVMEKVPPLTYLVDTRLIRPDAGITGLAREATHAIAADKMLDRAHALAQAVTAALSVSVDPDAEMRPAADVLEAGSGEQADHAHVLIAAAHAIAMPARFVSGYFMCNSVSLETTYGEDDPAPAIQPWSGHSWAELWVEGLGWVGFDAAQECCPDDRYIRLCSGRDAMDAAPLRCQAIGGGNEARQVALDVQVAEQ